MQNAAFAIDLTFGGTVASICTLGLTNHGVLGLGLDGSHIASDVGSPAQMTIVSVGSHVVTVSAPTWTKAPSDYTPGGESLEVAYSGLAGLGTVNQAFTSNTTNFNINTLPLTSVRLHARARNTNGFAAGDYEMKVMVTCS